MDKEKAGNRSEKKRDIYIYIYIYILELTEDVRRDGRCRAPLTTREGNQQRALRCPSSRRDRACVKYPRHTRCATASRTAGALSSLPLKKLLELCEITKP